MRHRSWTTGDVLQAPGAPILYKECATCHRPGESAPFSLLTYEDARKRASQLAKVTASRYMPPWLPAPGHTEFSEERRLTASQSKLFADWAAQGAPPGNPANAPPMPNFTSEWQMGQPDLILRVARPYKMKADDSEIFWNFVLPVPITTTRWVKAIEIRPGNPKAFHHANVLIDRGRTARRKESIPGQGFPLKKKPSMRMATSYPGNPALSPSSSPRAWHGAPTTVWI